MLLNCNKKSLELTSESAEVSFTIVWCIAKKTKKRLICTLCHLTDKTTDVSYFNDLSRGGGLTATSSSLADSVNKVFALLDFHHKCIQKQCFLPARNDLIHVLFQYLQTQFFV